MADQLLIRVDPELKRRLAKAALLEGKTSTQVVRDLIEQYVRERDLPSYVADLWDRIGESLKASGAKAGDIAKAIQAARKARARDAGRR
jgi:predicted DNA-binding protein